MNGKTSEYDACKRSGEREFDKQHDLGHAGRLVRWSKKWDEAM